MGKEISDKPFTLENEVEFLRRLREETKTLKTWFDERRFEYKDKPTIGLEIEAWLTDEDFFPNPINDAFLKQANDPCLVHELSQYNFEINVEPRIAHQDCFTKFEEDILTLWTKCQSKANALKAKTLLIGI
ncbi:MAG: hypothetical protein KDD58_13250, partial [Bdellovibrionales bacterium]|nr:hypothetical protein [Bdellovibrionales bacterium]